MEIPAYIPKPPYKPEEMLAWAAQHGIEDSLGQPASRLLPWIEGSNFHRSRIEMLRIHDCITSSLKTLHHRERATLHQAVRSYLFFTAERKALDARRAELWTRPLGSERLEAFARKLISGLDWVLTWRAIEPIVFTRANLSLIDPAAVKLSLVLGSGGWYAIETQLPIDQPDHGELEWQCQCRDRPCNHLRVLLEWTLDALYDPSHSFHAELVSAAGVHPWRRFVHSLHDLARQESRPHEKKLAWRVGVEHGTIELVPVIRNRNKRGAYTQGRRIHPRHPLAESERIAVSDADWNTLDLLSHPAAYQHTDLVDRIGRALEMLSGQDNVFSLTAPTHAVEVHAVEPEIVCEPCEGGFQLELLLGPIRIQRHGTSQTIEQGRSRIICFDARNDRCAVAYLPGATRVLIDLILQRHPTIPPEGLAESLDALARTRPALRLRIPDTAQIPAREAERQLVMRLEPLDEGLRAELVLRTADDAPAVRPAEGPSLQCGSQDGKPFYRLRDLAAERCEAAALCASIELPVEPGAGIWTWDLPRCEDALDLLRRIKSLEHELVLEWPEGDGWSVRSATPQNVRVQVRSKLDWLRLDGELELDGQRVDLRELLARAQQGERYIRIGPGRFIHLERSLRKRLEALSDLTGQEDRRSLAAASCLAPRLEAALDGLGQVDCDAQWHALLARIEKAQSSLPRVPKGIRAALRAYQKEGYRWLSRLGEWNAGACLADDMGLGKTLQCLALLQRRAASGPALVVAPSSVGHGWLQEARRFAPGLRALLYRGPKRDALLASLCPGDVLVTSYDILVLDIEKLEPIFFSTFVLDEAQFVKNTRTKRNRAARRVQAGFRLAMTGTPLENHLGELWSIFHAIHPGLLGSWARFRRHYAAPIERHGDEPRRAALAGLLHPFLLRRTKEQVAPELPPKTEVNKSVELGKQELRLYQALRDDLLLSISRRNDEKGRFQILAAITRLRRQACHPRLGDPASKTRSAKLDCAVDLILDWHRRAKRALVFSQFTSYLALLREALDTRGIAYAYLDGSTPNQNRAAQVARWNAEEDAFFLISLKAGGAGLNLPGADFVLHLDPWWNPAVEDQATDRTHRIGQTKPVTIIRLIAQGTIEETVLALHADKRKLACSLLEGADRAAKLPVSDLVRLIRGEDSEV
ncbi:MAG: DEAD/DEAH box helicase [Deltaproteobacteria bacterium]|nr:DEAD/DEAH box helicase [Deltaproteobacteria bacterium]